MKRLPAGSRFFGEFFEPQAMSFKGSVHAKLFLSRKGEKTRNL
ncbi:hypothetical protein M493_13235 [Geobacillus genomosp. 3]|uniref:Uncharacterized protein n=1 Tax=Geobacillus genomosp. 3 TaxID=1921421 RepID=S5Z1J9_GEOG3|nr:hypothetical protein M493_13235 [Geobacillus genomosp. 3]